MNENIVNENWFVISDTHWFHKNIIMFENRPVDHDKIMLRKWNEVITDTTPILHLGDVCFGSKEQAKNILLQLKGIKYLIPGNHDHNSMSWYRDCGFIPIMPTWTIINNKAVFFTHRPMPVFDTQYYGVNVHGHTHSKKIDFKHPERFVNVSVEVLDYQPVQLKDIIK